MNQAGAADLQLLPVASRSVPTRPLRSDGTPWTGDPRDRLSGEKPGPGTPPLP